MCKKTDLDIPDVVINLDIVLEINMLTIWKIFNVKA